jgi:hypothetical protein
MHDENLNLNLNSNRWWKRFGLLVPLAKSRKHLDTQLVGCRSRRVGENGGSCGARAGECHSWSIMVLDLFPLFCFASKNRQNTDVRTMVRTYQDR